MSSVERYASLGARVALSAIFLFAGLGKLFGVAGTAAFLAAKGLPLPTVLAVVTGVIEAGGGLLLLLGLRTRSAAVVLAVMLVPVTLVAHNPVGLPSAEARAQLFEVLKNLAILGGLLAVATHGAAALSLDAYAAARGGRLRHAVGAG